MDLSHPAPCHIGTEGEKEAMGILCDPILQYCHRCLSLMVRVGGIPWGHPPSLVLRTWCDRTRWDRLLESRRGLCGILACIGKSVDSRLRGDLPSTQLW